jgi:hypothetical protein
MPEPRLYTLSEANAALASVRPLLERIQAKQAELAKDKSLAAIRERAASNGGGSGARELSAKVRELEADIAHVQAMGIILRDPGTGLIDFFSEREGQTVFLCWKLGESRVEWWHPLHTGIAGRQRL